MGDKLMEVLKGLLYAFIAVGLAFVYRACAQEVVAAPDYTYLPDDPSTTYEQYNPAPEAVWALMGDKGAGYAMTGKLVSFSTEQVPGRWENQTCLSSGASTICVPAITLEGTCEDQWGGISACPVDPTTRGQWHVVRTKAMYVPPDNPRTHEELTGRPARFYTYRKSFKDPALYSNRQLFTSPSFVIPQAAMVVSMVFACRNKRSGEDWGSEVPAVAGLFVMDYLQARFISGLHALGAGLYATQHYARAAAR